MFLIDYLQKESAEQLPFEKVPCDFYNGRKVSNNTSLESAFGEWSLD